MSSHHEPKLLFNVYNIKAYHLQNGVEDSLTPTPQTMSLLMVPTSSPFADVPSANPQAEVPEEDLYLHLHLPPELDLPLPATTQIYHQPPCSYLIPRWDLGPDSGAFTRIEFPKDCPEEDIDTFESVLAQATTFFSRGGQPRNSGYPAEKRAPSEKAELPPYNPSTFKSAQTQATGSYNANQHGQIVLVDEENGSVVGELGEGFQVDDSGIKAGSKGQFRTPSIYTSNQKSKNENEKTTDFKNQIQLRSRYHKMDLRISGLLRPPPSTLKWLCIQHIRTRLLFRKRPLLRALL